MKGFLNAVKWELILSFKEYARYKIGLLMDIIVFTWTFVAVYLFGVNKAFSGFYSVDGVSGGVLVVIGYVFWQNASTALGYVTSAISNETSLGIFENRLQSKYPLEIILFCKLLAANIIHILSYIAIIIVGEFMVGFKVRDVCYILLAIIFSYITIAGMFGMGMIIAGITLIEKKVGSFIIVIQTILLFLSNALSPSRGDLVYLLPFTSGIELVRRLYLKQGGELKYIVMYVLVNMIWYAIGVTAFRVLLKHERENGTFDNY